jgi:hypothetical protein
MLFEPKHFAAVAAHPLEHAVAVEQPVIVDADLGVVFVEQLSRDEDLQRLFFARHNAFSRQARAKSF